MAMTVSSAIGRLAAIVACAVCLSNCGLSDRFESAESANVEFQQRVRLKQYSKIYDAAAPAFRKTTTLAGLAKILDVINRKLGTCEIWAPGLKNAQWGSRGSEVTANYTSNCSNGQLFESITWEVIDGKLLLTNFAVSSSLLTVE
jgi:hypothetical protein